MSNIFFAQLNRDITLAWRRRSDSLNPILFAAMCATLLPFAVGPDLQQLAKLAAGMTWINVLLANLLSIDSVFRQDVEDGAMDQILVSNQSLIVLSAAKLFCHWLTTGLPLVCIAPGIAYMLGLAPPHFFTLVISLLLGSALLTLIGGICAALTISMQRSGILLALLALPLYTPILIFGAGAMQAQLNGGSADAALWFLTAGLALALPLSPIICAAALRIQTR